jgi:hypothetical protein
MFHKKWAVIQPRVTITAAMGPSPILRNKKVYRNGTIQGTDISHVRYRPNLPGLTALIIAPAIQDVAASIIDMVNVIVVTTARENSATLVRKKLKKKFSTLAIVEKAKSPKP